MSDSETTVKRHELERVAEHLEMYQARTLEDNKEIKQLLKDVGASIRANTDEIKKNYVSNDRLEIRLAPHETIRKFFWWVAGGMGVMFLATLYQLLINGVKSL